MKQPKRALLVSLYIETLTHRPELTCAQAWRVSKGLYAKWKAVAQHEVKKLVNSGGISLDLAHLAREKIEKRESQTQSFRAG